jgi:hypothetical protein
MVDIRAELAYHRCAARAGIGIPGTEKKGGAVLDAASICGAPIRIKRLERGFA